MKYLRLTTIFSILFVVLFAVSCQKESTGDDNSEDTEETGGTGNSADMEATWARNDGQGNAYLKLSGTTAIACSGGAATTGTYNAGASTMTFVVGGQTIVFPLRMKNGKLIVGVPAQGTVNNQETEYIKSNIWPCGSGGGGTGTGGAGTGTGNGGGTGAGNGGGSGQPAKGSLIVWTNQTEYGWKPQGINVMYVDVVGVSSTNSIFGGHYTSAPSCGAKYCYTVDLAPGRYTVTGKVYFLKGLDGVTPPTYSTSQTVQVMAGQCANVMLR
ncbi:hypothetical protein [Mucilaginibacter sp. AK015]|uniref:hypothetical protein n=1 Tax=Mucilaginibacter sp. AK015 TaxID=2723072 RepID=UPI0016190CAB|nr:hypothetical protein [Mucilaginibacter sp. AK015]MBB5396750.1 hypothetical protein [Mucilaginibacter sp. AK015]